MISLLFLICCLFISPQQTKAVGLSLNELMGSPNMLARSTSFDPSLNKLFQADNATQAISTYSSISENILTNVTLTDTGLNEFSDENRATLSQQVKIHFDWSIPDSLNVQAGDTYSFLIPNVFKIYTPITGTLGEYGEFSVGIDGSVVMTFNENTQESSNVRGTLDFSTSFDEQKLIGNTTKLLYFPIKELKIFVVDFIPKGGTILSKSGSPDKSYNPKEIDWVVRANGNKSYLKIPTLKDNIPTGLTVIPSSIKVSRLDVYTDGTSSLGAVIDPTLYDVNISETGELAVSLNATTINAYQIEYSTTIDDLGKTNFTNSVELSAENTGVYNTTAKVSIDRSKHINKFSSYTQKNQKIKWTIEYNYNTQNIPVELTDVTDTFSKTHILNPDSIEIRKVAIDDNTGNATVGELVPESDYVITNRDTALVNGFNLSFNYGITDAYQIVYETMPEKDLLANQTIANQVVSPVGVDKVAYANRSIQQGNIMKSVIKTDYSKKKISWQQIINNNNYTMDTPFLKDRFSASGLLLDEASLIVTDTLLGNKLLIKGVDYLFTPYADDNGFTIEFIGNYQNAMKSTLKVVYDTTFDYSKLIGKNYFENTATMTWTTEGEAKTSSMIATVNPGNYTKDNGFKKGSYDAVKKELTWTVGANYNLYPINQLKILDTWDSTHQLTSGSVEVHKMKLSSSQNGYTDGGLVDPSMYTLATTSQSVSVVFKAPTQEAYYIVYKTKATNNMLVDRYTNTATLSDGEQLLKSYTVNVSIPNGGSYVQKTAVQNGEYVNWKLAINEGQSTISNAKIIDEPSQNQVIVESSIHLYDTTVQSSGAYTQAGELVKNKDYFLTVTTDSITGKQVMTITFASDLAKPYILTYQTIIDANDQEKLTNTVTLTGDRITTENVRTVTDIIVAVSGGSGTGTGERGLLSIKKTDLESIELALKDVEFQLYDKTGKKLYRTGTTDEQGALQFGGLRYGDYLLKETKAADGYLISNELKTGKIVNLSKAENSISLSNRLDVGSVELVLADKKVQSKLLEGAKYRLVDEKGAILKSDLFTDKQGKIQVDNLKPGKYRFVETTPPSGYERSGDGIDFTIASNTTVPVTLKTFNDTSQEEIQKAGKIFVHKLEFPEGATVPSIAGNGEKLSQLPENARPTAGVEVAIIAVEGNTLSETPSMEEAYDYYERVKDRSDIVKDIGVTDENGIFETKTLPANRYLIIDLKSEVGVTNVAAPVIVSLPMMLSSGRGYNNEVHVYTKNVVLLGAAKIQKLSENGAPLIGATFSVYRVNPTGGEDIVLNNLVTQSDGFSDIAGNLVLGEYYFMETRAPNGYLLNKQKTYFSISLNDHAYDSNGKLVSNKIVTSSIKNFKQPLLRKVRTTDASTDIGKIVSWKITADIPKNISEYKKYSITDQLDSRLDYKENLKILADGVQVNPAYYQVDVKNNLLTVTFISDMINFNKEALEGKQKLDITFDTVINSTAVPGVAIPNNAILSVNNGYVDATSTEANPPNVQTGGRMFIKQDSSNKPLSGAEFVVSKTENERKLFLVRNEDKTINWTEDMGTATLFISSSIGTFEVYGLAYGTYYLEETKAPKGYNLLTEAKQFVVDAGSYAAGAQLVIINSNAPIIPITGGIGTLLFFIIGLCVMVGIYLLYKKKYGIKDR